MKSRGHLTALGGGVEMETGPRPRNWNVSHRQMTYRSKQNRPSDRGFRISDSLSVPLCLCGSSRFTDHISRTCRADLSAVALAKAEAQRRRVTKANPSKSNQIQPAKGARPSSAAATLVANRIHGLSAPTSLVTPAQGMCEIKNYETNPPKSRR